MGSRPEVEDVSLSPDGTKLAYLTPTKGQGSVLMVVDLANEGRPLKAVFQADGEPNRINACHWTGNTRLICTIIASIKIDGRAGYASRMVAVDTAGGAAKVINVRRGTGERLGLALYGGDVIDWNPAEEGHVLMVRDYVPEVSVGTRLAQQKEGLGVDLVNTRTMAAKTVEQPDAGANEFISDGYGKVRIKGLRTVRDGYVTGSTRYYYRTADSNSWLPMSAGESERSGFDPHAVDAKRNIAYGLKRLDGRLAAYSMALDGSGKEELVFAHPQVDVSGFIRVGRRDRVIGVRYVTDMAQVHYIDPEIAAMTKALSGAVPDLPLIRVIDTSEDERKMVIWAGSDINPGSYFLFDRDAKTLGNLLAVRAALDNTTLAKMEPARYQARDGVEIPGYLTLPPGKTDMKGLPAIVMPHGGPEARDEWGFDWLVQYFAKRGYAVMQPNFRGSTGYGSNWFMQNGYQNWETAIGDVNDAGRWMVANGADPKRLAIFGWSYGGYAALQANVVEPDLFKAIIAVAPVTDLEKHKTDRRDWSDYVLVSQRIGEGPHIQQGSPARNASAIKAPVLMFHGDIDRNVDVGHARLMDSRLRSAGKSSELHIFEDRDHYLEDSEVRADMLRASAAFLEKSFASQ
ncbi:alpha/beta hydrolase family protein [Blastomonas aquatica]|uniref:Peptidase S9 n=1 Tax=Blastomonas aquatica TaxID=1510276 RepID=A0ABQ1ITL9_9SPHN|nr:S9 family peptidase [Blastomonas aquatica]GGB50209.1 peptidase S9 [Blastomonas aquatica]